MLAFLSHSRKTNSTASTSHDRSPPVKALANQRRVDWRTAAYAVALSRIEQVYQECGIFP